MTTYEYKVVPAPKKGERARGVKGVEARFANTLMELMNELGRDGWEYQRSDTLPVETRSGLTGKTTVFQNVLVFRRKLEDHNDVVETEEQVAEATPPKLAAAPVIDHDGKGAAPSLGPAAAPESQKPAPEVAAE